jgi:spore germination protein GerM
MKRSRLLAILLAVVLTAAAVAVLVLRQGPRGGPVGPGGVASTRPAAPAGGRKTAVELFFSSSDGSGLIPEKRLIPRAENALDKASFILDELIKGPAQKLIPLLPPEFSVRTVFVSDDILVIDLDPQLLGVSAGAGQEILMWYSVVDSIIMNVNEINTVHFLVDGRERDGILGHVDMKGAFRERLDLVRWY